MKGDNALSSGDLTRDEATRAITDALRETVRMPFETIRDRLIGLRSELLPRLPNDAERQLYDRSLSKNVLMAAIGNDAPPDVCREWFSQCDRLGYSHPYEKCVVHTIYADYCLDHELAGEALGIVESLTAELHRLPAGEPWVAGELSRLDELRVRAGNK